MVAEVRLFINGEWVSTNQKEKVLNKATGETVAEYYVAGAKEVDAAIAAAENAFKTKKLAPYRRYEILKRASELMMERQEDLALTISQEVGKTLKEAKGEVARAAQTLLISAEESKRVQGEIVPIAGSPGNENRRAWTTRVPLGIVCAITPFNVPANLTCHKVGPAIAAGNAVVYKPASATPIIGAKLCEIMAEAGLPAGYLNMVMGSGPVVGDALAKDQRIAFYSFTGSAAVGMKLKTAVGFRPISLELGSNSPTLVHGDADLAAAVDACTRSAFANAGQLCISVQRVYVHAPIYDEFCKQAAALAQTLKIGDPLDPATDIGPMISEKEAVRAEAWIQEAVAEGAKLLAGGQRKGPFLEPTVLANVKPQMKCSCNEVFAPVFNIVSYDTIDEAIALANDSCYGLQAAIFTNSLDIATRCAEELEAGGVIINDVSTFRADLMPYGGWKESGIGKEGPRYVIEEMTKEKIVVLKM
ncbi:aldehyde dehydrogenase family protein [Desulforamulus ruminis]|uniref:3-sulfolactaldehyde dehydrogenase n=1 Tax=Desulforamulus ruminis (strain ATCC 23193 / DSM 2154 / NCIMB 8452 / DL) TaxID=696281 RepID=F6DLU1_DESRL|nr:aldehyde dehydrogenase family protein [Desulforamulus ruminis]AEG58384.1 Aldehyde Dehydrogenase [Desulforamulus ruminis DSM 2154]